MGIDYLLAFYGVMASEGNQRFLWNSNSTLPGFFGAGYFRLSPFGKEKKSPLKRLALGTSEASVDLTEEFLQVFKPIDMVEYGGKTWVMSRPMKEMFEKMGVFKTPHAEP